MSNSSLFDYLYKVSFLSERIANRILEKTLVTDLCRIINEQYLHTIGVNFYVRDMVIQDKKTKVQLWFLNNHPRFSYVNPLYFKGSSSFLIAFNTNNGNALQSLERDIEGIYEFGKNIPVYFLGIEISPSKMREIIDEIIEESKEDEGDEEEKEFKFLECEYQEVIDSKKLEDQEISDFLKNIKTKYDELDCNYFKVEENSYENFLNIFDELVEELIRLEG